MITSTFDKCQYLTILGHPRGQNRGQIGTKLLKRVTKWSSLHKWWKMMLKVCTDVFHMRKKGVKMGFISSGLINSWQQPVWVPSPCIMESRITNSLKLKIVLK